MLAVYITASVVQHAKKGKGAFDTFVTDSFTSNKERSVSSSTISNSTIH